MIRGKSPSGPESGSGGRATLTSIGTPSQVGTVLRVVVLRVPVPHSRTPSVSSLQARAPPNTLGIAAWALGASPSAPSITASTTILRTDLSIASVDNPADAPESRHPPGRAAPRRL